MVGNRSFFISLGGTVLLVLLMASPIIAGTVTYLYSDSGGDIPLYRAISNKPPLLSPKIQREGG